MKRFLSIWIAVVMLAAFWIPAEAYPISDTKISLYAPDEKVTFIVEVEGDPTLAGEQAATLGAAYLASNEGQTQEAGLLSCQADVLSDMEETLSMPIEPKYTYTALMNGFAIDAEFSALEQIQSISGVKNVFVSELIEVEAEPLLSDSVEMSHAAYEDTGLTGAGQAVVVIDTEFDVGHAFFASSVASPKYTKESLASHLETADLSVNVTANQAYRNEKIPFAYNYCDKNADVSGSVGIHGTRVAGIIGGKNGTLANGENICGVAPDVQLILMKVSNQAGSMDTAAIFAALNDAVKMDVCAINCSFGVEYLSPDVGTAWAQCFENAYNAGIYISVAAGNSSKGFHKTTPKTTDIDYATDGVPASLPFTMSVAAANKGGSAAETSMTDLSSFSTNESLILKPDITAPGGSIYTSSPNDTYSAVSGTSLAAPHITGVVALLNEYLDKQKDETSGTARAELISNLMMSTAEVVIQQDTGVPYSPRVQGAGLVHAKHAMTTPVILLGDEGRTKLSLKDKIGESFTLRFQAKNLTDSDVVYDSVSVDVLTDGADKEGSDYYVGSTRRLAAETIAPMTVSVPANGTADVEITVQLSEEALAENGLIFSNGFFVEGFVRLTSSEETTPPIGIPYTGFYGDWTKAPVFDTTLYDDPSSSLVGGSAYGTFLATMFDDLSYIILGDNGGTYHKEYIAISPEGNGGLTNLTLMLTTKRTIKNLTFTIYDSRGNMVGEQEQLELCVNKYRSVYAEVAQASTLDDGDYTLAVTGELNYETDTPTEHTLTFPFYVDNQAPQILSAELSGNQLTVTAKDNKNLNCIYVEYPGKNGEPIADLLYITPQEQAENVEKTFTLKDADLSTLDETQIFITAYDCAWNEYKNTLACLNGPIQPNITRFTYQDGVAVASVAVNNLTQTEEGLLILAFYDENNALLAQAMSNNTNIGGQTNHTFVLNGNIANAKVCKLFVWKDQKTVMPLDLAKQFSVKTLLGR